MLKNVSEPSVYALVDHDFWDYFNMETSDVNLTDRGDITVPDPKQFVVSLYSVLLVAGALGNVTVFISLLRSRRRKSRVNLLMTHLAIADMIVTFIVIPLEIGWRTTNAWLAGNLACKFFLVLRAFGLYLSSNVLVCISVDRFFAIVYPLRLALARKRSKTMLYFAWFVALLCSLPQSLVFGVKNHPNVPEFQQCVSFEAFANQRHELAYNVFCLFAMYFIPLMIITVCYACIFYEISKNSKETSEKCQQSDHSRVMLRRSDQRPLARARRRTLRMTVTIVTVFACCWLPYATMTLWYMLDRQSAEHVSTKIQDVFFIMAVSNSCMDPLVYGSYTLDPRTFTRTVRKIFCIHSRPLEIPGISGPDVLKSKVQTTEICHHDHLPNDMQNYMEYHVMGFVTQVRMKPDTLPSKFDCQPDRRKRAGCSLERPYALKKQRMTIIEECLNESVESNIASTGSVEGETSVTSTGATKLLPQVSCAIRRYFNSEAERKLRSYTMLQRTFAGRANNETFAQLRNFHFTHTAQICTSHEWKLIGQIQK